jgi:hypothetical protein
MGVKSVNVGVDAILEVKGKDLRLGDGWRELAGRPICTNCHARLDYGLQFFLGYRTPIRAVDFIPLDHLPGKGPLYAEDITDPIGQNELTPRGFAELVTKQDRFASCMVRRVREHVFGDDALPEDTSALLATFKAKNTLRSLMRVALERFAARQMALIEEDAAPTPALPVAPALDASAPAAHDTVMATVSPALRDQLDAHCVECHDDREPKMRAADLPRSVAREMLTQVAFFGMPKTAVGLAPDARKAIVRELVSAIWTKPDERAEATRYFDTGFRPPAVHRILPMLGSILTQSQRKDARPLSVGFPVEMEVSQDLNRFTPGVAALAAFEALHACRSASADGETSDQCFERITSPDALIPHQ